MAANWRQRPAREDYPPSPSKTFTCGGNEKGGTSQGDISVCHRRAQLLQHNAAISDQEHRKQKRYFPSDNFDWAGEGGAESQHDIWESDQVAVGLKTAARKALMFK